MSRRMKEEKSFFFWRQPAAQIQWFEWMGAASTINTAEWKQLKFDKSIAQNGQFLNFVTTFLLFALQDLVDLLFSSKLFLISLFLCVCVSSSQINQYTHTHTHKMTPKEVSFECLNFWEQIFLTQKGNRASTPTSTSSTHTHPHCHPAPFKLTNVRPCIKSHLERVFSHEKRTAKVIFLFFQFIFGQQEWKRRRRSWTHTFDFIQFRALFAAPNWTEDRIRFPNRATCPHWLLDWQSNWPSEGISKNERPDCCRKNRWSHCTCRLGWKKKNMGQYIVCTIGQQHTREWMNEWIQT